MKELICRSIEEKKALYAKLCNDIWARPERNFQEMYAAKLLTDTLAEHGFRVEQGLAGMPSAFRASFGSGKPVVSFLAEYDALAGLSQEACCAEKKAIVPGGDGHGCGHNAMGPCCIAAAVAMKEIMEQDQIPGTVIVFGCPAEETGGGKSFLARDGFFDGVDFAISPHPFPDGGFMGPTLATVQAEYTFTGQASHASAMPEQGRSALDAAELMVMGVQFLREHIIQEARIHHAYLDVGGTSPNVVQANAKLFFYIRAPKGKQVREIFERINKVARGAAMMTETEVAIRHKAGLADLVPNHVVGQVLSDCWAELGPCVFSPEARAMAEQMAPTVGLEGGDVLDESVPVYDPNAPLLMGSTDVGDVSYIVPSAALNFPGVIKGTPGHSWQWVSQAASPIMHDGLVHAAKVSALAGMKLLTQPELAQTAREELMKKTGCKLVSMLPPNAVPEF